MEINKQIFFFILLGTITHVYSGVQHTLQLSATDSSRTTVTLPFAYKELNQQEKNDIRYVPECCYTVLKENEAALVGPLQPCKLVAIKSKINGKTIVFHKNDGNSTEQLCKTAQKVLGKESRKKNISAYIFGVTSPLIEKMYQEEQDLHQTQLDKIKYIKDTIVNHFKIKDRSQVQAQKFSIKTNETFKDYGFAQIFILIDNKLNKSNCCPMHENFFNIKNLNRLPLFLRSMLLGKEIKKHDKGTEVLAKFPNAYSGYEKAGFLEIK